MWDALIGVAQHALTSEVAPDSHGARPRISVTTSLDVLRNQIDQQKVVTAGVTKNELFGEKPAPVAAKVAGVPELIMVAS